MTSVAVSGAAGRMGRLVAEAVQAAEDLELVALYDPAHAGEGVTSLHVTSEPHRVADADVVVEFTRPDVVMGNLAEWRRLGVHAVVGTSGFDAARISELRDLWPDGPPNCLVAPNFSIGAVLLMHFAAQAAAHFDAAEVVELHHDGKADAPSGTAIATAERIAAAARPRPRPAGQELVAGARGAGVAGVHVHAVRLPGLVAHQEVILGAEGQTLTLRHDSTDRRSFLPGVLLAIRNVADMPGVTIGLESLLGLAAG